MYLFQIKMTHIYFYRYASLTITIFIRNLCSIKPLNVMYLYYLICPMIFCFKEEVQRSGIDTIKYHT